MTYKDDGIALLKALSTKCASIDSQTRLRAKNAFINCRMSQEETAINFLTRLKQIANEARNYEINISEKKFIYRLLDNMKHHKYYRGRIASLMTNFELHPSAFNRRWLEIKFYVMDEERSLMSKYTFRGNRQIATARYASQANNTFRNNDKNKKRISHVEVYDPTKDSWTVVKSLGTKRNSAVGGVIPSTNQFMIAGGYGENWNKLKTVEVCDCKY